MGYIGKYENEKRIRKYARNEAEATLICEWADIGGKTIDWASDMPVAYAGETDLAAAVDDYVTGADWYDDADEKERNDFRDYLTKYATVLDGGIVLNDSI